MKHVKQSLLQMKLIFKLFLWFHHWLWLHLFCSASSKCTLSAFWTILLQHKKTSLSFTTCYFAVNVILVYCIQTIVNGTFSVSKQLHFVWKLLNARNKDYGCLRAEKFRNMECQTNSCKTRFLLQRSRRTAQITLDGNHGTNYQIISNYMKSYRINQITSTQTSDEIKS